MAGDLNSSAEDIYEALKHQDQLSSHRLISYRCQLRRCMLLDVIETPVGRIFRFPRYKLPPGVNETLSNEAGRAASTEDGGRKWTPATGFEREVADSFEVNCDHIRAFTLTKIGLADDVRAGRREATIHT